MILIVSIILNILSLVAFVFYRNGVKNETLGVKNETLGVKNETLGSSLQTRTQQIQGYNSINSQIANYESPTSTTDDPCTWVDFLKTRNGEETFDAFVKRTVTPPGIKCAKLVIYNNFDGNHLHLAEVRVYNLDGHNVAQNGGSARQSTTSHGFPASNAINGKTSGEKGSWIKSNPNYISHTEPGNGQWWHLDITPQVIRKVKIYNRKDCCMERLKGAYLVLYDENNVPFYRHTLTGVATQAVYPPTTSY